MAYAQARSCVKDLHAGMTDGAYKRYAINRGGEVEDTTANVRRQMSGAWHGFRDIDTWALPDGREMTAYTHVNVDPDDIENI